MNKKLTFLGIETSCDETAASIVRERENNTADVLSNIISSQIEEHKKFGGVVPEIAARAHVENIDFIISRFNSDLFSSPKILIKINNSIHLFLSFKFCLSS